MFVPLIVGAIGGLAAGAVLSSALSEAIPLTKRDVRNLRRMPEIVDEIRNEVRSATEKVEVLEGLPGRIQDKIDEALAKLPGFLQGFSSLFGPKMVVLASLSRIVGTMVRGRTPKSHSLWLSHEPDGVPFQRWAW